MDIITKIIIAVGAGAVVMGLTWGLSGLILYLKGRKNKSPQDMDEGLENIINGGILVATATGIAGAIVTAINNITF